MIFPVALQSLRETLAQEGRRYGFEGGTAVMTIEALM
jgi:hypothetical protein